MHVIASVDPVPIPASALSDARLVWIGMDDRGIELEVVALDLEDGSSSSTSCRQASGDDDMTEDTTYRLGPDLPDTETLRDSAGRVIDDAYVDTAVEDAIRQVRGRGRPSLSEAGESPLLRVRISRDLDQAVRKAAKDAGASRSAWVRQALEDAARRTG